ncbi:mediator complex subunit [Coemansia asiatica]|nr:mediator complex subunit [Coemansia asiatica]
MWSTVQRVPNQNFYTPDDRLDRTQVPGTSEMDRQQSTDSISTALGRESDSQQTVDAGSTSGMQYRDQQQHQQRQQQQRLSNGSGGINQPANRGGAQGDDGFYDEDGHAGRRHLDRPSRNGDGNSNSNGNGNGNGRDGSYSDSDAEALSEIEDLPQINVQMIPLSVIVGRLITFAYTELVTLVDTLPSRAEGERRNEILKYTEHMSDLLKKLLVLVRWAKNAPQIQKCQNVIAYLDTQNRFFEYSVDSIYATFLLMPNVRMRNYDVSNAVDILTTGSYQRLPVAIKRMVPPPRLTKKQIRETLEAINDIIRDRLLRGEPIPQAMRQYKIANGRITFTVPKEFEATLTLLQFESGIPWHVVDVKVLVSGDRTLPEEQQIVVNTWQIVDKAQHLLIQSSAADQEQPDQNPPVSAASDANSATLEQDSAKGSLVQSSASVSSTIIRPPQLAQLYDFLHRQCLVALLETIVKQAAVLRRTRWENLLQVEMSPDRTMLTLRYWTSSRAASASKTANPLATANQAATSDASNASAVSRGNTIVFKLCPLPVPRPIHASAAEGPDALEAAPRDNNSDSAESSEFFRIEQDRRNLIPKIGLNVTWSAQAGLTAPKVWSQTVTQASELQAGSSVVGSDNARDFDLSLDPEEVNTERLLRQITWRHSRTILESLHASVVASGLFSQDAVQFLYITPLETAKSEGELTRDEIKTGTATPKLRAWYRQDEGAVDITIDAFTGRLVVRASEVVATSTSLSEAMIGQLADQLNRSPWRLAELLVDMRSSLALVDLDSLALRSLGLRPQNSQGVKAPSLPGFVLSSVQKRLDSASGPQHPIAVGTGNASGPRNSSNINNSNNNTSGSGMPGATPHLAQMGMVSLTPQPVYAMATASAAAGFQQSSVMASNFPLRVSQQEADALMREVAGVDNPLGRIRFYKIEGTEGVEEQLETTTSNSSNGSGAAKGEWYIMVAMTDRLRFRLVLLNPHPTDRLMFVVGQVISLQVDRLFSSVARRLIAEKRLDTSLFMRQKTSGVSGAKRGHENDVSSAHADNLSTSTSSTSSSSEREITEKVDAMLTGRTSITLDYLNALASTCRARLALRLLQTQLTRWKIPYSFRLPSFSTSPHGHRAAVSKELSVVGLDKMGLYELDEQVPTLYIPVFALMRASPINWSVVNMGVLPDESRRMVSIRIASDELDPSMRADLSSSTRVDQHRQAALAKSAGRSVPLAAGVLHSRYASISQSTASGGNHVGGIISDISGGAGVGVGVCGTSTLQHRTKQSLIGRHVVPCQVIASIPVALDGLPTPIAQAYADAVYFGAHAAADGGYHRRENELRGANSNTYSSSSNEGDESKIRGGYSKMVLVYKQVNRALQCLIRDWSEHHLMTHIGRYMYSWERRSLRRVLASTMSFYPFNAGPYTGAVASTLGSWRGHQSTEIVIQCLGSCYLSISCRVPYPFANEDKDKSMYPPDYEDSGGSDLTYHLTLADIDSKTRQIRRIASTWPWVFAHNSRSHQEAAERGGFTVNSQNNKNNSGGGSEGRLGSHGMSFEVSTSMSRWLRTLQARLNLTGNPISVLMMIVQLMPINHMLSAMSPQDHLHSLSPLTSSASSESLLHMQFKDLVGDEIKETTVGSEDASPRLPEDVVSHQVLNKLSSMSHGLDNAFDSVRGLNVMYMYTAADNVRIVFNSRYVVDLRLVSSDLFHIRDVVGTAHLFSKQPRTSYRHGSSIAPEPLITSAAEPIPLFDNWLDAMSRGMRFDWAKYEKGMSVASSEMTASASSSTAAMATETLSESLNEDNLQSRDSGLRQRIRMFQRNLFRLHPNAPKAEQMMFKFRELFHRQNSAKSPTLVPLPPSGFLCSRLHLVSILRSLMQWLVKSVHLRDQLESAILRTQEVIENAGNNNENKTMSKDGAKAAAGRARDSLFSIKEKLVVKDEMESKANKADSGLESKQVMIVGFTGARESVRCEFLMRAGVADTVDKKGADGKEAKDGSEQTREEEEEEEKKKEGKSVDSKPSSEQAEASSFHSEPSFMSYMFELFTIPADLMKVDLDVRIVPMNRPPNGITDAAANFLVNAFKSQKANNRQRAGSLVRILALPPQLVMDVVDIGKKLNGKVSLCLLRDGFEYDMRLDPANSAIVFSIKFCNKESKWLRLFVQYALLSGTAKVVWAIDPNIVDLSDTGSTEQWTKRPDAMLEVWNRLMDDVIAAMDNETAFTRDMGKSGKSRLYDIISRLYEAQLASPLVSGGRDEAEHL